jgi:hypothetical protein
MGYDMPRLRLDYPLVKITNNSITEYKHYEQDLIYPSTALFQLLIVPLSSTLIIS